MKGTKLEVQKNMNPPLILVIEAAGSGGTEVYVEGLAHYISQRRPVEIVTLSGDAAKVRDRFPGLETTALPGPAALRGLLRERPGAVVNLHLYSSLLRAAVIAKLSHKKVISTLHLPLAQWSFRHRLAWRIAVSVSDHVVGVSTDCLSGLGPFLSMESTIVAPAPLPLNEIKATNPLVNLEKDRGFNVLCTARLEYQKDIPTLIKAISMTPSSRLTLLGDGSERVELEKLARELNVEVEFAGKVTRETVFKTMQTADIFVLPSRFEGLGIAAIEAMALGVPTVVADFPAASDYILPERTGLLFPVGDHAALAQCLTRLTQDPDLRQTLSNEGARHVRDVFSEETQFGKYERVLETMRSDPKDQSCQSKR